MTEQRFDIIYDCQGVTRLIDRENKLISLDFGFDWNDLDDYEKDRVKEWLVMLNEQQATIRKIQDLCGKSDGENAKLRIENKMLEKEVNLLKPTNIEQYEQIVQLQEENEQLQAQLREKEQDERLYANEIVKLNKEAKEVLDFKSLGGNY